jgi:hypothetical protein
MASAVSNADITMSTSFKHLLLVAVFTPLSGCVYLPSTTTVYNAECQTYERHLRLERQQISALEACQGDACKGALIAFGAITAATAIVSGSIVVLGNAAYWLEEQGLCLKSSSQTKPE